MCILTLSYSTLLRELWGISTWYGIILILFLFATVFLTLRSSSLRKNVDRTNDTLHILGNSYYAIYRINIIAGTYEMIKGSDYVRQRLPYEGEYQDLLEILLEVINDETREDFARSFSLENIRRLGKQRMDDFGGDFLRLFGDTYRWVYVRLLLGFSLNSDEAILCFREIDEDRKRQLKQVKLLEDALAAAESSEKFQK